MDKRWGLTLDSASVSDLFPDKTTTSSSTKQQQQQRQDMFQFPVCSSTREDCHGASSSSPSSDENRQISVEEVDFFSDDRGDKKKTTALTVVNVKEERFHCVSGQGSGLDVNTGLHLLTANNTGSDQSKVDDGVSSDAEDKRVKNEMAQLQEELKRMNAENQKLKDMVSNVSNNNNALQTHLANLMQHQKNRGAELTEEGKPQVKKQEANTVARQFLDLRPSAIVETDELFRSSSEERTRSGSPPNDNETCSLRDGKRIGGEESPESNKSRKLNPAKKCYE